MKRAGVSRPVRNLVAVLIDKRRTKFLGEIVEHFAHELNLRMGFAEANITSARDLSVDERGELERNLARVTGKSIRAKYTQDRTLLGGATARVGSTVYDGSVKGQLERIRQQLSSGGV